MKNLGDNYIRSIVTQTNDVNLFILKAYYVEHLSDVSNQGEDDDVEPEKTTFRKTVYSKVDADTHKLDGTDDF